jgi:hypothetical protein
VRVCVCAILETVGDCGNRSTAQAHPTSNIDLEKKRHSPNRQQRLIHLDIVRMQVLLQDAGAAGEEGHARDEEQVQDDDAGDGSLEETKSADVRKLWYRSSSQAESVVGVGYLLAFDQEDDGESAFDGAKICIRTCSQWVKMMKPYLFRVMINRSPSDRPR